MEEGGGNGRRGREWKGEREWAALLPLFKSDEAEQDGRIV